MLDWFSLLFREQINSSELVPSWCRGESPSPRKEVGCWFLFGEKSETTSSGESIGSV